MDWLRLILIIVRFVKVQFFINLINIGKIQVFFLHPLKSASQDEIGMLCEWVHCWLITLCADDDDMILWCGVVGDIIYIMFYFGITEKLPAQKT